FDREIDDADILRALNLLSKLNARGISLMTDGQNVFFLPESSVTNEERDAIRELNKEFLDLAPRGIPTSRCKNCGERITDNNGCPSCTERKRCANCGSRVDADGDCPVCPGGVPF
ncbi:MAG: hypothetical protein L0226_13720, partial [Acidobacteria bacterium]|nr:hypothetical protein [Acidobacteriota bacterium]